MFAIKACVRGSLCLRLQFFLKTRYDSGTEIVVITEVPNIREFSPWNNSEFSYTSGRASSLSKQLVNYNQMSKLVVCVKFSIFRRAL